LHLTSSCGRPHRPRIKDREASFFTALDYVGSRIQMRDDTLVEDEVESSGSN
jgi:hypothetical protein